MWLVNESNDPLHLFQSLVNEIRSWIARDWDNSISHMLREVNSCVNILAKGGAEATDSFILLWKPPQALQSNFILDFRGTVFVKQ